MKSETKHPKQQPTSRRYNTGVKVLLEKWEAQAPHWAPLILLIFTGNMSLHKYLDLNKPNSGAAQGNKKPRLCLKRPIYNSTCSETQLKGTSLKSTWTILHGDLLILGHVAQGQGSAGNFSGNGNAGRHYFSYLPSAQLAWHWWAPI